jgi:hypothetical protein
MYKQQVHSKLFLTFCISYFFSLRALRFNFECRRCQKLRRAWQQTGVKNLGVVSEQRTHGHTHTLSL